MNIAMEDKTTDYSSGESFGSDKHLSLLSTILEECSDDTSVERSASSSFPGNLNREVDSKVGSPCGYTESENSLKFPRDKKSVRNGKQKKKVAFLLPTNNTDSFEEFHKENFSSNSTDQYMDYQNSSGTAIRETSPCSASMEGDDGTGCVDSLRLEKLQTVLDILERSDLSNIFKGFDSGCCSHECKYSATKKKKTPEAKKKIPEEKKKLKRKENRPKRKGKANKKVDITESLEFKCDHSKTMRNKDGTRVEVDHHFKNSTNTVLLSWLEKKKKEDRKKRREERRLKQQERAEKKMQALVLTERKHLSDTLVKDWVRKKKKELRKLSKTKVEPALASCSSTENKAYSATLSSALHESFSSGCESSSGSFSKICTSDSGISTTSLASQGKQKSVKPLATPGTSTRTKKTKLKKNQVSSSFENSSSDDLLVSKVAKNTPVVQHYQVPPKSVWADNSTDFKVPTSKKLPKSQKGIKNFKPIQSSVKPTLLSKLHDVRNESLPKKSQKKPRPKTAVDKMGRENVIKTENKKQKDTPNVILDESNNPIDDEIIRKEIRRRLDEKFNSKKQVSSRKKDIKKNDSKQKPLPTKYRWLSEESEPELSTNHETIKMNQRPEPQGSDNLSTKFETKDNSKDDIPAFVMKPTELFYRGNKYPSNEISKSTVELGSNPSAYSSDGDVESIGLDTDNCDSEIVYTENESTQNTLGISPNNNLDTCAFAGKKGKYKSKKINSSVTPNKNTDVALSTNYEESLKRNTVVEPISRRPNKDLDDCIDFFLEDYKRPWMEI